MACQNSQQRPTQPSVALQPTATYTNTSAPTNTSTPTITATSTPAVTPSPTPTLTPIFTGQETTITLQPVPLPAPNTLALHPPDSAVLLQVMAYLYQSRLIRRQEYFVENNVEKLLNHNLQLYFADGWPNAQEFVTRPVLQNTFVEHGTAPLQKIINQGLLEHLNSQKVELKNRQVYSTPTFHLVLNPVDVVGDGSPQWVVELRNAQTTGMYKGFWGVLYQNTAGEYTFLAENLLPFEIYYQPEQLEIYQADIAGTPALELIVFTSWYMGGTSFDELHLFSWDGKEMVNIGQIDMAWGRDISGRIPQPTYDFSQDVTGDGRADLQLTFPFIKELNCQGETKLVYSWSGTNLEPTIAETPPTETVECVLWEGIQQQDVILLEKSLTLLENDPSQPADLITLNLIHLSMAHFVDGNEDIAQNILSKVMALPAEPLTQLVQTAYQQTPAEPLAVCRYVHEQAQQAIDSVLAPQLTELAMMNDPGFSENHIYPHVLCRVEGTIKTMLQKQPLLAAQNPVTQLQQLGLSVLWSQEIQLTDSPTPEWLVVLADLPNSYLTLETITTTWSTTPHTLYFDEFIELEVGQKDVTGDGLTDVVGVLTSAGCEEGQTLRYHVLLLASADPLVQLGEQTDSCGTPAWTVETITTEQIDLRTPVADWYNVSELASAHGFVVGEAPFYAPQQEIEQYLNQLADQILTGSHPVEEIEELLVHMPVDNPAVEPYYAHLLFFLGYYYELNGESDLALDHYLRLVNTYPSSVWSWLAWARIN